MSKLSLVVACALFGLVACGPLGGMGGEGEGDWGIPVPFAKFLVKKFGENFEENLQNNAEQVKYFKTQFLKYVYQRKQFEEAEQIKERMEGKEDMLQAAFKQFVAFMKAKKAGGDMGGMDEGMGDMGGMGGEQGDMGGEQAGMGGMEGGMEGGMGGMEGGEEGDALKKLKLKVLWEEMLNWDRSFQSALQLKQKDLSKQDFARVFFEIFLNFLEKTKALEEKAKHAAAVIKYVDESRERAQQEREQREKEEKMKMLFMKFVQWHKRQQQQEQEQEGW